MEQWKAIENWERYEVSDLGNIRNAKTGRILKPVTRWDGRKYVDLHWNGKRMTASVHRVVAKAFIENPDNKAQVNHINGNPSDNRVENLEWVTNQENQIHAHRVLKREPSGWCNPRKKVVCVETGVVYSSMREAARAVNANNQSLWAVCNEKRKTCRGFHWKYV